MLPFGSVRAYAAAETDKLRQRRQELRREAEAVLLALESHAVEAERQRLVDEWAAQYISVQPGGTSQKPQKEQTQDDDEARPDGEVYE